MLSIVYYVRNESLKIVKFRNCNLIKATGRFCCKGGGGERKTRKFVLFQFCANYYKTVLPIENCCVTKNKELTILLVINNSSVNLVPLESTKIDSFTDSVEKCMPHIFNRLFLKKVNSN